MTMREHWERHSDVVMLRPQQAAALLQPAFPGAQITAVTAAQGGKANSNLKVERAEGPPLLVRLFVRDPQSGAKECALLRHLAGRLPVPRLHYFAAGNPATGHPYAVLDWIEGARAEEVLAQASAEEALAIARSLGAVLAAIGRETFSEAGFLAADLTVAEPFATGAAGFLGFVAEMVEAPRAAARLGDLGESLLAFCEREAGVLDALDAQARLVHCDFDPSNILLLPVTEGRPKSWEVAAVIDWEFALAGPPLIDLGHLLRPPQGEIAGFAAALAAGYREAGGTLPERWLAAAKLLDLLAWLDFLNRPGEHPRLFADARRMIEDCMNRWPAYCDCDL